MEWTKQTHTGAYTETARGRPRLGRHAPSAGRTTATEQHTQENATRVPQEQTEVLLHTARHTGLLPTCNRAHSVLPFRFISRVKHLQDPLGPHEALQ